MTRTPLTTTALRREYVAWGPSNRNSNDLRFGQYLEVNYTHVPTGFLFAEDKDAVFAGLLERLQEYQR
ncbi:hypothetical protein [Paracoccus litorisediminis]|uniref:Uncharacterized protein n=1 Tax=Paracoccus litorisediminis TaxID=2006130 RepID=A0A844HRU4_9RHOB|nr:hypothetical protein [Paracoccus litorisediminis]MTH61154.1 hypothetical protein [Paracoccus litorisediminis]